jgi:hypothetical protein
LPKLREEKLNMSEEKNIIKLLMQLTLEQAEIISNLLTVTKDMSEELVKNHVKLKDNDMFTKVIQNFQRFQNTKVLRDKIKEKMDNNE